MNGIIILVCVLLLLVGINLIMDHDFIGLLLFFLAITVCIYGQ